MVNGNRRGDMYIKLQIVIPKHVSGKAKNLLKELSEVQGEESNPDPIPLK